MLSETYAGSVMKFTTTHGFGKAYVRYQGTTHELTIEKFGTPHSLAFFIKEIQPSFPTRQHIWSVHFPENDNLLSVPAAMILSLVLAVLLRGIRSSKTNKVFRRLQLVSSAAYSLGHGANDAQKTMGLIAIALVTAHQLERQRPFRFGLRSWRLSCSHRK